MRIARERLVTRTAWAVCVGKVSRPGVIPGPTVIVRMKRERDWRQRAVSRYSCSFCEYVCTIDRNVPLNPLRFITPCFSHKQESEQMQPTAIDSKSKSHHGERVAFIQACWHKDIVDQSRKGFVAEMLVQGYQESDIDFFEVGGAFEIPLHAK